MKKKLLCIALAFVFTVGLGLTAQAEDLALPAPSCILMEKDTRQILYEENAHEKLRPASVTKIMTLLLVMEALESGSANYDFVEVMACPGGCAGGGGQPIHEGEEWAAERGALLWELDAKSKIRFSHENPEVKTLYSEYLKAPLGKRSHQLLHTDHTAWSVPSQQEES